MDLTKQQICRKAFLPFELEKENFLLCNSFVLPEIRYNCITAQLQVKLSCNMNCKLLQAIFGSNATVLNNEQFKMSFNSHYISKFIIAL